MEQERESTDEQEKKILRFWKDKKIYEKSVKQNAHGKKFYMMDGPPYATGSIHMGTALNKILKDIAMRSHRLQGFDVFDRAGYDTHGVPIELKIEKELGFKSKNDIEKYGVKKFIGKCKAFATKFIGVMNGEFENLGAWLDYEDPYLTLNDEYIETIWDTFKIAEKKGLLYLGKYPVHICPRCETAVAFNEIEYDKQEDNSVFVKFPLKDKKNTFLIIWTTTPWTLPGNTGVMVHPDFVYQEVELSSGEKWIIAKELVPKIMTELGMGFTIKKDYKGKEMEGRNYENPLFKDLKVNPENSYRVVLSGRYVNLEEGTGLVHCAPGHGKEDFEVGRDAGLGSLCPVSIDGSMTEEAGKYAGKKARVVDAEIIEDLEKGGFLVYKMKYTHDYPLCWRCSTPLLMVSLPQWFLKISEIQGKIMKENETTNWIPSWMKLRMKAWLEGLSDWPVSRERYWGTPLPIWVCDKCDNRKVIGSKKELEKLSNVKVKEVHKPDIDNVEIPCSCSGKMKRVTGVLDVWFDSGVSSWAALKYKGKDFFNKYWPADLNIEGKDQVRGWWNSQFILSMIKFDKKPFESIMEHGMILDLGKKKMSKSKGNIVSPQEIFEKHGRDYLRYYFAKTSKGEDFSFDESEFKDIRKVFMVLSNLKNFIFQLEDKKKEERVEDKWIMSKFNSLIKEVSERYDSYKFPEAVQLLENFLVNDFSRTYVQIIRDRSGETYDVMKNIYIGLLKLCSPVVPFITERVWQDLLEVKLVKEESVHLSSWPKVDEKKIDKKLEEDFGKALEIIENGLAERNTAQIGLKWPLAKAVVTSDKKLGNELQEIIARQLNVKKIEMKDGKTSNVKLDTKMTPELEAEGYAREIARKVQALRKKSGLVKTDNIDLLVISDLDLKEQEGFLKERTNAKNIKIANSDGKKKYKHEAEEKIKGKVVKVSFDKVL